MQASAPMDFYGTIIIVDVIGIVLISNKSDGLVQLQVR